LGSTGGTCGTLAGALAVIGFFMGKETPSGRDHKLMWKLSHKMVRAFQDITSQYGGINCKDIARVDWKDINKVKAFYKDPNSRRKECFKVIGSTVEYLEKMLDEYEIKMED